MLLLLLLLVLGLHSWGEEWDRCRVLCALICRVSARIVPVPACPVRVVKRFGRARRCCHREGVARRAAGRRLRQRIVPALHVTHIVSVR